MYEASVALSPKVSRWSQIQQDFLDAMWEFDRNFAAGTATQADNQNGKGDFFTDLIALLLENCSEKFLYSRGAVPGFVFRRHALDVTYPRTGSLEVLVETKMLGAPKTPRNPKQKNPLGRAGSADLEKRLKEAIYKTIDLKAEWARLDGQAGTPFADLQGWVRRSRPSCFLFLGVRVVSANDLKRVITLASNASAMLDGVGLFAFAPSNGTYVAQEISSTSLELDRTLWRACTELRALP